MVPPSPSRREGVWVYSPHDASLLSEVVTCFLGSAICALKTSSVGLRPRIPVQTPSRDCGNAFHSRSMTACGSCFHLFDGTGKMAEPMPLARLLDVSAKKAPYNPYQTHVRKTRYWILDKSPKPAFLSSLTCNPTQT